MSSSRPPFDNNFYSGASPNFNMNQNRNVNRRSWNGSNPASHGRYTPNRFGSPFTPSIVEQKHMYQSQNNSERPSPVNYNAKSNCMTPPSPFHTPRSSNASRNSSFQGSFNNSPRRAFSPRYPSQHSSPYSRQNNRNSMGRKSYDSGQKPWKPPAKGYFKQSMLEDPWQYCKGSKVQNNGDLNTSANKVKKGRYFS